MFKYHRFGNDLGQITNSLPKYSNLRGDTLNFLATMQMAPLGRQHSEVTLDHETNLYLPSFASHHAHQNEISLEG